MRKDTTLTRRGFLAGAGASSAAGLGMGMLNPSIVSATDRTEPMKITKIESVTFNPNIHVGGGSGKDGKGDGAEFYWLRLHTDHGIVGTGETYPFDNGQVGAIKDYAKMLIGRDPRDIDGVWRDFYFQMAMRNAGGADMRILSAVNMAQLDILGQAAGLPLYRLLGGKSRDRIRVYNTTTDYWAINNMKMGPDTIAIAQFLMDRGITGIKFYPFRAREKYLSNEGLDAGLKWIRDIRDKFGDKMDICVDCWANFDLPSAERVAKALEPYNIMYLEDIMVNTNVDAFAELAAKTSVPLNESETLATRYEFLKFFERKACSVCMFDVTWCGGPSEAKKIADLADAYTIPISPHTCGGPLLYICAAHVATAAPNFLIMESNYWKYTHQYPYFVTNAPVPVDGHVTAPELPGVGAGIKPELFRNGDAIVETVASL